MKLARLMLIAALSGVAVVQLQGCAATDSTRATGEYVDDKVITSRVKTALLADPVVKGMAVDVETFRGVVQLSGFVDTQEMARRAVTLAQGVPGVREVKNDMRLRPRG